MSARVIARADALEIGFWYLYYFATERGRAGRGEQAEIAKVIWKRNSPAGDSTTRR